MGTAIKGAQKDSIANKLMTDQSISEQPGAGQTFSLGKLGGDTGGPQPAAGDTVDPNADLSTDLPEDVSNQISTQAPPQTFTNPSSGNIEPLQGQAPPQTYSGTNTDPLVAQNVAAAKAASQLQPSGDSMFKPSDYSGGSGKGTVGGLVHTGGVDELNLQKEMLAMQLQKQSAARQAAADARSARADAYEAEDRPLNLAMKRAQLAATQARAAGPKVDLEKNPPPATNLDNEPVLNETQLSQTVDKDYGTGTYGGITRTINIPMKVPSDPNNPNSPLVDNPDENAPVMSADGQSITVGPKNKRITMPIEKAKILAKQYNSVAFKKGTPLIRVPGETDQTLGATKDNPYPVNSKLDMVSRAHGTWVRLPGGQIAQVP